MSHRRSAFSVVAVAVARHPGSRLSPPRIRIAGLGRDGSTELESEECVDRRAATAGDGFGVVLPVARIEGLEAPWSRVFPGREGRNQGLELDDAFPRQDAVGVLDLPWRFVGCVIQM